MNSIQRALMTATFLLLTFGMASTASAQVTFSGDARFRPRLDLDDRPESDYERSDLYFMYRMRLNMTAAIGEGYYVKSRLSHNGIAFYQKGGQGEFPDIFGNPNNTVSNEAARRPSLDMMYMYLGRATEDFGFDIGLIPVVGFSNPLWDLHYYPGLMVDVPFFIWNTDGAFGGRSYYDMGPGRLTVHALLDRDRIDQQDTQDGQPTTESNDQYTLTAAYAIPIAGITVEPTVMKTFPSEQTTFVEGVETGFTEYGAPLTLGANVTFPKVAGFTPSGTFGYTTNDRVIDYTGWLGRAKVAGPLGPGSLLAWVDLASRTDELEGADRTDDFLYWWLAYSIPIYSGERGSFVMTPEWRFLNKDRDDELARRRNKFEINFDITFR
jgi:hypothetical protein